MPKQVEVDDDSKINYKDANNYWDNVESSVNGMLGGWSVLTEPDARDSNQFYADFSSNINNCGSGIGRVTSTFLINHFEKIDLVEQTEKFLDAAKNITFKDTPDRIGRYINLGLQNFTPEANKYDLIWCQWVLGHLPDQDLISLLKRFHGGLKSNGLIGVKENISRDVIQFDTEDSSVTRNEKHLKEIFEKAGLVIIKEAWQSDWPLGLYPVKMFLLRPN